MANLFEDLIPKEQSRPPKITRTNMFEDLIPSKPKEELGLLDKGADLLVDQINKPKSTFKDIVMRIPRGIQDVYLNAKQSQLDRTLSASPEEDPLGLLDTETRQGLEQDKAATIASRQEIRKESEQVPFGEFLQAASNPMNVLGANPAAKGLTIAGRAGATAYNTALGYSTGSQAGITEEEKKDYGTAGAVAGATLPAVFGTLGRGLGKLFSKSESAAPNELPVDPIVTALPEVQQEALGKLALAARQPFNLTEEQARAKVTTRTAQEIQTEINQLAQDTASPGAKEKLTQLQAEKATLTATDLSAKSLTPEQFETNIYKPVEEAYAAGVPIAQIQEELVQGLQTSMAKASPDELTNIIEAALAPLKEINPITAPVAVLEPAQAVKAATYKPPQNAKLLNVDDMQTVLQSMGTRAGIFFGNDLSPIYKISRIFSKRNGNIFGSADQLIEDPVLASIKNRRQQSNDVVISNLFGDSQGTQKHIIEMDAYGTAQKNTEVLPFQTIQINAQKKGVSVEAQNEFRLAAQALSDRANREAKITELNTNIAAIKTKLLDDTLLPPARNKLAAELDAANAELREVAKKSTYTQYVDRQGNRVDLSEERAQAIFNEMMQNPAAKEYLEEMAKWTRHLLDMRQKSGLISKDEAERIAKANPYYLNAQRDIDEFGYEDLKGYIASGSATKALRGKTGSDAVYNADPIANTVANGMAAVRASNRNIELQQQLELLMTRLDDEAFGLIFRESKDDIKRAIQQAKFDPEAPNVIKASSITEPGELQKVGGFKLYYNGKAVELTFVSPVMEQAMTRPTAYTRQLMEESKVGGAVRSAWIELAQFNRNIITTLNPVFNTASFLREAVGYAYTADQRVVGRAALYKPWKSYTALRELRKDPELYQRVKDAISPGVTKRDYKDVRGKDFIQEIVEGPAGYNTKKGLPSRIYQGAKNNKIVNSLEEFAQLTEAATRYRYMKDVYAAQIKKGVSPDKAKSISEAAGRSLGVNYQEKGASQIFNSIVAVTPFLRTTINSLAKDTGALIHRKQQLAEVTAVMTGVHLALDQYNSQFGGTSSLDPNIRLNNFVIKYGSDVNDYFLLPRPFMAVAGMSNITAEGLSSALTIGSRKVADEYAQATKQAAASSEINGDDLMALTTNLMLGQYDIINLFAPVGIRTYSDLELTNKDYRNKPIVPDFMKKLEPDEQVLSSTSQAAIRIGNAIGVSPIKIQYAMEQNFGAIADAVSGVSDLVIAASQGKEKPLAEANVIPGVRRFSGAGSNVPNTGSQERYSNTVAVFDQVAKTAASKKRRNEEGTLDAEEYSKYLKENKEILNTYENTIKPADTRLKLLYKQLNKIQKGGQSGERTPEQEVLGDPKLREKADQIRTEINTIQEDVLRKIGRDKEKFGDLWQRRLRSSPVVGEIQNFFRDYTPDLNKELDKQGESGYNADFSFISGANAAEQPKDSMYADIPPYYQPPALTQQYNQDEAYKPNIFEDLIPNINKEVTSVQRSAIIDKVLKLEGGYSNNPNDKGGPTNMGITLKTLRGIRPGATIEDLKALSPAEVKDIYKKYYWDEGQVDKVPAQLRDIVFDGNINHGVPGMTKVIQRALKDLGEDIKVDGKMGNATLNLLKKYPAPQMREAIIARRESLYKNDSTADIFGEGWNNRLDKFRLPTG